MPHPPSIDPVLRWLRGGPVPRLDGKATRVRVVELLVEGRLHDGDASAIVMAFESTGTDGVVSRLRAWLKAATPGPLREAVHIVLAARRVGAEPGRSFVDTAVDGMRSLLTTAAADRGVAEMLVTQGLAAGLPPEALVGMFAAMTAADRLPVGNLLAAVLQAEAMAGVHHEAVQRFSEAASPDDAPAFHLLAGGARDVHVARALREAALRLGTRGIETQRTGHAETEAWMSTCDGLGAFRVVVRTAIGAGRFSVLGAVIRHHQGIRDLVSFPCRDEDEADDLLDQMAGDGAAEVPILPEEALGLVESALVDGVVLEPEEEVVLATLRRTCGQAQLLPDPPPGGRFDKATIRSTLHALALDAWFFDDGDLGVVVPARRTAAWRRSMLPRVGPVLQERLVGMCRHMARFCALAEEPERAGLFSRAALDLAERVEHPLTDVLLERAQNQEHQPLPWASPMRDILRQIGFFEVRAPRNADLARLDLSEQAELAMEALWRRLPGESMLRERDQHRLALKVGDAAAVPFLAGAGAEAVARAAREAAEPLLGEGAAMVAEHVAAFTVQVCATCPTACPTRPNRNASRLFFREGHPAVPT